MRFYIDFEATQFSERIISIGCVADNGQTFYSLVKPVTKKDKANEFITKLTGITNEMLATAPSANEVFIDFLNFIIINCGKEMPEYYCYGDADASFLKHTISHMTNIYAINFATTLQFSMKNFALEVKEYFHTNSDIALRKVYALISDELVEQSHNALDDALMLKAVVDHMADKCKAEDIEKIAAMPKAVKPLKSHLLQKAPQMFVDWPADKWIADTEADADHWAFACKVGPYVKYFNDKYICMLWLMRYITQGKSVKNLKHQEEVMAKIDGALSGQSKSKNPYGFTWIKNMDKEI